MDINTATENVDVSLDNLESLGKEELERIQIMRHKMKEAARHGKIAC